MPASESAGRNSALRMHLRMVTDNLSELILENLKLEPRRLVRWIESRGFVIDRHIYLSKFPYIII